MITQEELERVVPKRPRRSNGWRKEVAEAPHTSVKCSFEHCDGMAYGLISTIVASLDEEKRGHNAIPELDPVFNQWLCYDHFDWVREYATTLPTSIKWGMMVYSTVRSVREAAEANLYIRMEYYTFTDKEKEVLPSRADQPLPYIGGNR